MCDSPLHVNCNPIQGESGQVVTQVPIPCGKCGPCIKRRIDTWVFRLLQEDRVSKSGHFVTLTYAPDHLPRSKNNLPTLVKSDLQKFFKRLRKLTGYHIRYYAVGEYGTLFQRPHYHIICFGCPTPMSYALAWAPHRKPIGSIHVGMVSGDSIAYCAGYIQKGRTIPQHARDDRVPQFSVMSNGLGISYLTPSVIRYHKSHLDKLYLTLPGGKRIAMPRYYRDKIFTEDEKALQRKHVLDAMEKKEEKHRKRSVADGFDNYSDWCDMHRKHRYYVEYRKKVYKKRRLE
ncbi:putative replication initiation protein [Eel River basin pequenovirus]|nr:putative replication initiation protein [Eel River basin pequenovirus]